MIIDNHVHLASYSSIEIPKVLHEINEMKILTIDVSMDLDSYLISKELSKKSRFIIPCVGLHPWKASNITDLSIFSQYLDESPAIGEVGLDFYWQKDESTYKRQIEVLDFFLESAYKQKKVVNLHTKGAEKKILEKIKEYSLVNPVIHWYSGPKKFIKKYLDAGSYFSFGVELKYSKRIQDIIQYVPNDRILLETDNPGGYEWLVGRIGLPSLIHEVAEDISKIKKIEIDEVLLLNKKNFSNVYENSSFILDKLRVFGDMKYN